MKNSLSHMFAPKYSLYIYLCQKGTSPLFYSRVYANRYPSGRIYKNRDSNTKGIPVASKIIL